MLSTNSTANQPVSLEIDPDSLTIGECELLEDVTGFQMSDMALMFDKPGMKLVKALAFIAMRRTNPDVTLDDISNIKLTSFTAPKVPDAS